MSQCRSCRAPITWAGTVNGKPMPLDAAPYEGDDERGLFAIHVVDGKTLAVGATPADDPVYRSHFATCPNAKEWRRS